MVTAGFVAAGFDGVAQEFERNFTERGEVGAAFSAVRVGETVVDVWGGLANQESGKPWEAETLSVIFSGTKGLCATCLLVLVDRGQLDPDSPVCRYWPEFAANGKELVLVRDVASHQGRLPGIRTPLSHEDDVLDDRRMASLLAAQAQESDPRAANAYHPLTYGWLCGELVRRVDGRSIGRFFADEIAQPLGLDIWIGLPVEEEQRVAWLQCGDGWSTGVLAREGLAGDDLLASVWGNRPLFTSHDLSWNKRGFHAAEVPASGGIATARSMARLYACLARGGELDGVRLLSETAVLRARQCLSRRRDPLLDEEQAFGFGFELQTSLRPMGPPEGAFGHSGAGGSDHAAWPEEKVGFSYCMNLMRDDQLVDPRLQALLAALYRAV